MRAQRRIAAVAAVAAAVMMSLTGCGGGSGSGGDSLTVYVGAQPNYPTQFAAWSKDVTAKFKAATGADLTIETFSSAGDETTKIQSSIVAGTGPDVYQLGSTFTPVAYGTKGFVELTPDDWTKAGGKDRLVPPSLGMSGPDATTQIGIPIAMRPYGMVYNTDLLAAAGITSPPTTWDDLVADAKKLTTGSTYGLAVGYADGYDPWKYIWSLTEQSGGSFVSDDLKTAQLNSTEVNTAVAQYFGLLTEDEVVDPQAAGWKAADALAAFATGKAAILPMATATVLPTLADSPVNGKFAFAPMPSVPFGASSRPAGAPAAQSIVSGDNVAIASYSKNKDLALAYVKLITDTDMQVQQFTYFGNLPTNSDALDQVAAKNPIVAPFLDAEKGATPTAFTGAWADVQNGVQNVVVQSQPDLANGTFARDRIKELLDAANTKAQSSLTRASR